MSETERRDKPVGEAVHPVAEHAAPQDNEGPPEVGGGLPTAEIPRGPCTDDKAAASTQNPYERWTTVLAAAAFFVSLGALAVGIESCKASRRSADVSAASVRAWIVFKEMKRVEEKNPKVRFSMILKNAGATPATAINWRWQFVFVSGPDVSRIKEPEFRRCPSWPEGQLGVAWSQQEWTVTISSGTLDDVSLKMLADKTAHLYLYMCVGYRDVLGSEEEPLTEIGLIYPATDGSEGLTLNERYNRMK